MYSNDKCIRVFYQPFHSDWFDSEDKVWLLLLLLIFFFPLLFVSLPFYKFIAKCCLKSDKLIVDINKELVGGNYLAAYKWILIFCKLNKRRNQIGGVEDKLFYQLFYHILGGLMRDLFYFENIILTTLELLSVPKVLFFTISLLKYTLISH